MRYLIKSLVELEKLKIFLFDSDQYALFEHIPKPLLYEEAMVDQIEEDDQHRKKKFLEAQNNSFWMHKNQNEMDQDFASALDRIRNKLNPSVIDKRLIDIIDDFGG